MAGPSTGPAIFLSETSMRATIKNNSPALQGVRSVDGLVFIAPGRQRTLDIPSEWEASTRRLPFLAIDVADDPLDHDGDGKKGGVVDPSPLTDDEKIELLDAMTDDELREFITERDGKAPHHKIGRDKLLSKARGE